MVLPLLQAFLVLYRTIFYREPYAKRLFFKGSLVKTVVLYRTMNTHRVVFVVLCQVERFCRLMENVLYMVLCRTFLKMGLYSTKKGSAIVTSCVWCCIELYSTENHMQRIFKQSEERFHHAKNHLSTQIVV